MYEFADKIKRHYRFSKEELKSIVFASVILGFIFALRKWSNASIGDFLFAVILVFISIFIHISAQKMVSLQMGYGVEFQIWWYGILTSLVVCIMSQGKIWWLILPGGIIFSLMAGQRLGKFRYGLNYGPMGWIGFVGALASIIFGSIFKNIELYITHTEIPIFHAIFMFNLAFAVASMLPIPPLNGHYMFFASRPWYTILFGTIFAYAIMTLVFGLYSWVWAVLVGLIIWLIYYISFEKEAW